MRQILWTMVAVAALAACKKKDDKPKDAPKDAARPVAAPDAAPKVEPTTPTAPGVDVPKILADLYITADCGKPDSPNRVWCIAANGWAGATAAPLPAGSVALPGLVVTLLSGVPYAEALSKNVFLAGLALHTEGDATKAKVTTIIPSSDDENMMIAEAVMGLATVFKQKADSAPLPKDLLDYLATLAGQAEYPVTAQGPGWVWAGASTTEARKIGDYWVTIEIPEEKNGIWLGIYTDKVTVK